ncbi:MAG: YigZ family protein [Ruminococcaceae bacterium]|nr:YigZ family protein [Oscillospiraceae bacterium]
MRDSYVTARGEGKGQYEEKKSIFYGFIKPIEEEEDALEYIEEIRNRLPNMRHTCFAYVNKGGNVVRFSDDKEPQGTAGMPILEVIRREGLTGVVIVVARFFGGVLLGAGGLTRAYGKAAKLALDDAGKATFVLYEEVELYCDYSSFQKLKYELSLMGIEEKETRYEECVIVKVLISENQREKVFSKLSDITSGKGKMEVLGEKWAPLICD